MSFWKGLLGNIFGNLGGLVATDTPNGRNIGGNIQARAVNNTNATFNTDYTNLYTTTATSNIYIEPGTNITIEPGGLGGQATITTFYDNQTMDRLIHFENGTTDNAGTAGNIATWTNGTSTAAIQDLRIQEWEWRQQQTQRQAARFLQGRINDHLNQQFDQLQQAQQNRINIANDNVYNPFGGGLQGQRHAPPNLDTPRAIAEVRGQNLLKKILGDILYRHYEKNGYVDVPSIEKPGVGFRIRAHRRIGLLKRNRKGQWVEQKESLCIHASGGYWVEGDQVGIHYMLCQCDEKKLWKQAIVHTVAA